MTPFALTCGSINKAPENGAGFYTHPQNNYHLACDELAKVPAYLPHLPQQTQDAVHTIEPIEKTYAANCA